MPCGGLPAWLKRFVCARRELGGWGISGRLLPELVGLTALQRLCVPPAHLKSPVACKVCKREIDL